MTVNAFSATNVRTADWQALNLAYNIQLKYMQHRVSYDQCSALCVPHTHWVPCENFWHKEELEYNISLYRTFIALVKIDLWSWHGYWKSEKVRAEEPKLRKITWQPCLSLTIVVRKWTSSFWLCAYVCVCMWLYVYVFFVVVFRCKTLRRRRLPVFGLGVISILTAGFDSQ